MRFTKPDTRSVLAWLLAAALAAFSLLPIANWIPGGHEAPWYRTVASGWITGSAIVLGVGVVLAIISQRVPALWRDRGGETPRDPWRLAGGWIVVLVTAAAGMLYLAIALLVFDGRPLHIDEISQLLQASTFAEGRLWRESAYPEFFSSMHMVDAGGRTYSHFPAGGPAMLVPGVIAGAPWIIVPLCGAVAVWAVIEIMRLTEPRPRVAFAAALLTAFAPFLVFMSGTFMNHVPALMWLLIAVACLIRVMASPRPLPWVAMAGGFAFGAAATIRPVDAFAFALPAGIWYLARAVGDRQRWKDALASAAGVVIPMTMLAWVNWRTTGAPHRFGYEVLWGKAFGLGFHDAPWGDPHTPVRGVEILNLAMLRLGTYLFETPIPALIPAIVALSLSRRLHAPDRYLLACSAFLLGLNFLYWHDGFYVGPRFMIPLVPVIALWTARFLPAIRERAAGTLAYRTAVFASITAVALALIVLIPSRAQQYSTGLATMRWNADAAAEASGVQGALVLVRESWGSQVLARLWARDVSRTDAERLYRYVDTCALHEGALELEARDLRGEAALRALAPLMRDSARVVPTDVSPDRTERMLPGARYSVECTDRVMDDRAGFTSVTPLLLATGGGNVYARDLHAKNLVLLRAFPDRPVFLLRPPGAAEGLSPAFIPLRRDSLESVWSRAQR